MAGARSLWHANGMRETQFGRPIIGIANSFTQFVPGHVHLHEIGQYVKRRIEALGCFAAEFDTIAVDDGIAMGHGGMLYSLPSREIIADSIEYMANAHCIDALVLIGNCDKVTPGMLMAAMRLNIPTVFVSGGPMEAGRLGDREIDLIDAMVTAADASRPDGEVARIERSACPGCGSCSGMFTANSMNCLTEALGLALPGNGTLLATHANRRRLFETAAELIVRNAARYYDEGDETVLPRSIATKAAFENAMSLDIAMGGSTNTVLHLLAAAHEAGVDFTMHDIDRLSRRVPVLCKVAPNSHYHIQDVNRAGGIFALLGELGEERDVILELKSIADVALVGFPSAGKSSLIAAMSSAKPKIADYPFTTLVPNLGVVIAGDSRYTIADVPGLIPGASEGKGLGLEFLRHIERTEIIAHVIDCATLEPDRDPMSDYHALENELALYADKLELPLGAIPIPERPRIVILNKIDVPEAKELAEFVRPEFEKLGLKVFEISTASHEGLKELNFALSALVHEMREEVANREQAEEEARVVIKPLETKGRRPRRADEGGSALEFTVERRELGNGEVFFEVRGVKPERWVMQTNFDNDEAVGYLADRLAKLGVEDELRRKGAHPGDEVRIGRGARMVEFDWDPTISAGAEMLDGSNLGARGKDLRLEELDPRTHRRSNAERRAQYHEMMDARAAVRDAMMAERKAGHWADPTVDDDRHDETSLFGHGESSEDGETEE